MPQSLILVSYADVLKALAVIQANVAKATSLLADELNYAGNHGGLPQTEAMCHGVKRNALEIAAQANAIACWADKILED